MPEPPDLTPAQLQAVAADLRVVIGQVLRQLRDQGRAGEFTRSQASVLRLLERDGPATLTQLARAEGVRPQSMSAIVTVLEDAGLVSRAADPRDGRKTVLALTEAARQMFTSGRLAREDWLLEAIQTRLTPAQQQHLPTTLDLLRRIAGS